jgi:hypothetical protein
MGHRRLLDDVDNADACGSWIGVFMGRAWQMIWLARLSGAVGLVGLILFVLHLWARKHFL